MDVDEVRAAALLGAWFPAERGEDVFAGSCGWDGDVFLFQRDGSFSDSPDDVGGGRSNGILDGGSNGSFAGSCMMGEDNEHIGNIADAEDDGGRSIVSEVLGDDRLDWDRRDDDGIRGKADNRAFLAGENFPSIGEFSEQTAPPISFKLPLPVP